MAGRKVRKRINETIWRRAPTLTSKRLSDPTVVGGAFIKYVRTEGEGGGVLKAVKYAYDSTDSLQDGGRG